MTPNKKNKRFSSYFDTNEIKKEVSDCFDYNNLISYYDDKNINDNTTVLSDESLIVIRNNIRHLSNTDTLNLINENTKYRNKAIKEVVIALYNGNIDNENVDSDIDDEELKREIKYSFIENEISHLKAKFKIKRIIRNGNFEAIKKGFELYINEMQKIKYYKPSILKKRLQKFI